MRGSRTTPTALEAARAASLMGKRELAVGCEKGSDCSESGAAHESTLALPWVGSAEVNPATHR